MTEEGEAGETDNAAPDDPERIDVLTLDWLIGGSDSVMRAFEGIAAVVLVFLFGIGVFDLGLGIVEQIRRGRITDPLVVVGFIDTALLLFIIVEVYQTVVAYTRENDTRTIVRLVIYTGVIAMVRKVIIYRTEVYTDKTDALLVAVSYAVIILGLAVLLVVEQRFRT